MSKPRLALALAAAVLSIPAAAAAERPDYRADGSVALGDRVFPSREAYFRSAEFRGRGARCGANRPDGVAALVSPGDCTFQGTTINPDYDDDGVLVIQVVFHVIKRTDGTGDLSPEMLQSQIDILNEDFNALAGTPGGQGTNGRFQFVLARFDPDGEPTTGIEVITHNDWFTDNGGTTMQRELAWDPTRYLNIYTNDAGGYLGYATLPQGSAGSFDDGVVLLWEAVGRNSPAVPYDQGRTATHEVGHYLGLFHTFDGGCGRASSPYTTGDLLADTVAEAEEQYGCTPSASSCGGGMNPIENYMDYTDDTCMTRFTPEQINRMRCGVVNYRNVNTAPTAGFSFVAEERTVTFTSASSDAETPEMLQHAWSFGDGETSTEANPVHAYAADGTYQVTLEVVDLGSGTATVTQAVMVAATAPVGPDGGGGGDDGMGGDLGGGCCDTRGRGAGGTTTALACGLVLALLLTRSRRMRRSR